MIFDTQVKLAIYHHFAETGRIPSVDDLAVRVGSDVDHILDADRKPRAERVPVLGSDGESIRMTPPFSGVPTQQSRYQR